MKRLMIRLLIILTAVSLLMPAGSVTAEEKKE